MLIDFDTMHMVHANCHYSSPCVYVQHFWASRGFVAFNIDYRLAHDQGLLPLQHNKTDDAVVQWNPKWQSAYPAVRDLKAAIRFVKHHATSYGVDPNRVVVSGGSAGATNSVAAGATFVTDYVNEISTDRDPTLAATLYPGINSSVQCVVAHWSSEEEVNLPQQYDVNKTTRWSADNAPIVEFHGNKDTTIPIEHAYAAKVCL